jgi:hypothetical protein
MKLHLAIRSKKERVEVDAKPFSIRMKEGVFAVVAPMFDDWTRTENFDLRSADAVVDLEAGGLVLEFPSQELRDKFTAWLEDANAKAEHGYKTMWP